MKHIAILLTTLLLACGPSPDSKTEAQAVRVAPPPPCTNIQIGDRCEILANQFEPAHYGFIGDIDCSIDPPNLLWEDDNGSVSWRIDDGSIVCPPVSE